MTEPLDGMRGVVLVDRIYWERLVEDADRIRRCARCRDLPCEGHWKDLWQSLRALVDRGRR